MVLQASTGMAAPSSTAAAAHCLYRIPSLQKGTERIYGLYTTSVYVLACCSACFQLFVECTEQKATSSPARKVAEGQVRT